MSVLLCLGVQESTVINNILTVVNLAMIAYIIICGVFKANVHNWKIPASEVNTLLTSCIVKEEEF